MSEAAANPWDARGHAWEHVPSFIYDEFRCRHCGLEVWEGAYCASRYPVCASVAVSAESIHLRVTAGGVAEIYLIP